MPSLAFWSPMPPQASGISDYSFALAGALAQRMDVTVVVDASLAGALHDKWLLPDGVGLCYSDLVDFESFDFHLHHMGNHTSFHTYIHHAVLSHPGVLVLHDPALVDFYEQLLGGDDTLSFAEELRFNLQTSPPSVPRLTVDGQETFDRLSMLMSRRVVEASALTIVHSEWARSELLRRSPTARIECIPLPAVVTERRREPRAAGKQVVGVLGGIARHKRVLAALTAFAQSHVDSPGTRMMIAGRPDDLGLLSTLRRRIDELGLEEAVSIETDVSVERLDELASYCDVVVSLRWPTAGETSATVMRAFGAGTMVIASDVPQLREFSDEFCWKVPTDERGEIEVLEAHLRRVFTEPDLAAQSGAKAQAFVRDHATYEIAASRFADALRSTARSEHVASSLPTYEQLPDINALGCWDGTTGLAEAARRSVSALVRAGYRVSLRDRDIGIPKDPRRLRGIFANPVRSRSGSIDLCFLNINELHGVTEDDLRARPGNYAIASWYWELPTLPHQLIEECRRFDEIWVGSSFVGANLSRYTDSHIEVIPPVVEIDAEPSLARDHFGLPSDSTIFFFHFDANSVLARKNPWAVIDAFELAFANREAGASAHLVVKTMNLWRWPEADVEMRQRLGRVSGILIDAELSNEEMTSLINCCDAYVSLHRTEGFGLGIAEAMLLGKSAIVTDFSGNTDFTFATNSCLVDFEIAEITAEDLRYNPGAEALYQPGMQWANPRPASAARWMRILHESPRTRRRIGEAARATILERHSSQAAAAAMRRRLEAITRKHLGVTPVFHDHAILNS